MVYICKECGNKSIKWHGQCPVCHTWNSFSKEELNIKYNDINTMNFKNYNVKTEKLQTNIYELDRVFGEGIVIGSLNLISGEPGIGKSTLILQMANSFLLKKLDVLYVSCEESDSQIYQRMERLKINKNLEFMNNPILENILYYVKNKKPQLLIIDSIQMIYSKEVAGIAGNLNQIRYATEKLMEITKKMNITTMIIGHITKDGSISGPKVLEHLVDSVFLIEGERSSDVRIFRCLKNRFGPTDEIGILKMTEKGLQEAENPNTIFFNQTNDIGSVISAKLEGSRVFIMEIESLVTYTKFGYPKRTTSGIDLNRLNIIIAIISKFTNIKLDSYDVYVSTTYGIQSKQNYMDLAIALSIISSKNNIKIPSDMLIIGELGLTGRVKPFMQVEKIIKSCQRLGIKKFIIPSNMNKISIKDANVYFVNNILEAIKIIV